MKQNNRKLRTKAARQIIELKELNSALLDDDLWYDWDSLVILESLETEQRIDPIKRLQAVEQSEVH